MNPLDRPHPALMPLLRFHVFAGLARWASRARCIKMYALHSSLIRATCLAVGIAILVLETRGSAKTALGIALVRLLLLPRVLKISSVLRLDTYRMN